MKYQYQMGGIFEDVIEGVLKAGGDVYSKEKDRIKEQEAKQKEKAAAADKMTTATNPLTKATNAVLANPNKSKTDYTKWALIILGVYLLTKGR